MAEEIFVSVSYNDDTNSYTVQAHRDTNVNEMAFCCAVIARCLTRDGIIESPTEFTDLVAKYAVDPQYQEQPVDKLEQDTFLCRCGEMLHFDESCGKWTCDSCGYIREVEDDA